MLTGRGPYSLWLFTLHRSSVPFADRGAAGQRDCWLATSESNRALPPYRSGPFDRLGRGQQMAEVPTPSASAPFRVQAGGCHPAASPSRCGRRRIRPPAVARSPDFESGTASMAVSSSTDLPRRERAGGCGGRRSRLPAPCGAHPLSKRSRPPGRFILQARKAGDLNARVSPRIR